MCFGPVLSQLKPILLYLPRFESVGFDIGLHKVGLVYDRDEDFGVKIDVDLDCVLAFLEM